MLIAGCAQKIDSITPIVNISEKYYIIKEPSERDKKVLQNNYMQSNKDEKSVYGILLGGYFYKINDYEMAKSYLEKFKDYSGNSHLEVARDVWLADIMVRKYGFDEYMKDIIKADEKYKNTEGYDFFFKYFCKNSGENFLNCFRKKYNVKENILHKKDDTKDIKDNLTESDMANDIIGGEPYKNLIGGETINIFVDPTGFETDLVKGIITTVENQNLPIQIKTGDYSDGFYLDGGGKKLLKKDGSDNITVSFSQDYTKMLNIVGTDHEINKSKRVYIITGDNFGNEGAYLKSVFEDIGTDSIIFGFDTKEIRFEYRYDEMYYGNDNISFVVIGKEDEILKYVPFVKFTATNPDNVTIYAVTDLFSGKEITSDYVKYFKNIRLASFFNAITEEKDVQFSRRFEEYYGKTPEFEGYVGREIAEIISGNDRIDLVEFEPEVVRIDENSSISREVTFYERYGK